MQNALVRSKAAFRVLLTCSCTKTENDSCVVLYISIFKLWQPIKMDGDVGHHKSIVCNNGASTFEDFSESLNVCLQHYDRDTISRWSWGEEEFPLLCAYLSETSRDEDHIQKTLLLIEHDIGIYLGSHSYTPTMLAIIHGEPRIVRAMLEKGVDLYDTGTRMTYLEQALVSHDDPEYTVCKLLLEFGYDIRTKNMRSQSVNGYENTRIIQFNALFFAVLRQRIQDVRFLLSHGLPPDDTTLCTSDVQPNENHCGEFFGLQIQTMTPLFCSVIRGNFQISQVLLEHGANPNFRTNTGMTALEFLNAHEVPFYLDKQYGMMLLAAHNADVDAKTHLAFDNETICTPDRPRKPGPFPYFQQLRAWVKKQKRIALGHAFQRRLGQNSWIQRLDRETLENIYAKAGL